MRRVVLALVFATGCFSEGNDAPSAGTDATPCDPGVIRACSCEDGAVGNQVCLEDGSGYDACMCGDTGTESNSSTTPDTETLTTDTATTPTSASSVSDPSEGPTTDDTLTEPSTSDTALDTSSTETQGTCTHRVFVTAGEFVGNFGGLDVADTACQDEADSQFLGGTWVAVLSNGQSSAASRIGELCGDVVLANDGSGGPGALVSTADAWWSSLHEAAINHQANGDVASEEQVWTGTTVTGASDASTCVDWTDNGAKTSGRYGNNASSEGFWIDSGAYPCSSAYRLYCFEVAP